MTDKYWVITHNTNTETSVPTRKLYVKTTWKDFPTQQLSEIDILSKYVQSISKCHSWAIRPSSTKEFIKAIPIKWSDHKTKTMRLELEISKNGRVTILSKHEM
ncbi:MAG: hypothetical protein U9Q27_00170 [Patescibacteria group bacterium]|nr:hypothetical protein [Patescibacteria group bacterium]